MDILGTMCDDAVVVFAMKFSTLFPIGHTIPYEKGKISKFSFFIIKLHTYVHFSLFLHFLHSFYNLAVICPSMSQFIFM